VVVWGGAQMGAVGVLDGTGGGRGGGGKVLRRLKRLRRELRRMSGTVHDGRTGHSVGQSRALHGTYWEDSALGVDAPADWR